MLPVFHSINSYPGGVLHIEVVDLTGEIVGEVSLEPGLHITATLEQLQGIIKAGTKR